MITTIIITALASVTITLVIGYFIWSGISVRKLKKQVENNKKGIHGNGEWIKMIEDRLSDKVNEIYENVEQIEKNINTDLENQVQRLEKNIDSVFIRVDERVDDIYSHLEESDNEKIRELDKRFDKVYQQLNDIYHNKLTQKQDK